MFGKKAFIGRIFGIAIGTVMLVSLLAGIAGAAYSIPIPSPTPTPEATDNLYAGSDTGHVYQYQGGQTWNDITPTNYVLKSVAGMTYGDTLYVSYGSGGGHVYKYEFGTTWTDLGAPDTARIPQVLYYANNILYSSANNMVYQYNGSSWNSLGRVGNLNQVYSLYWYNGKLWAAGLNSSNGDTVYEYVSGEWITRGRPQNVNEVKALYAWKGKLYARTRDALNVPYDFNYLSHYVSGTSWALDCSVGQGPNGKGTMVASADNSVLYTTSDVQIWQFDGSLCSPIGAINAPAASWDLAIANGILYGSSGTYYDVAYVKSYSSGTWSSVGQFNSQQMYKLVSSFIPATVTPIPTISLNFNQATFTAGDTKYSNISVIGSGYTVKTYVNVTMPDGTQKYAYYANANFQPTDSLLFSDTKVPLYDGTWDMHDEVNWTWNIYAMTGNEQVGTWTWNFWYEDVNNPGVVLASSTASYSVIKKEIKGKISFIYDVAVGSLPLRKAKVVLVDAIEKPVATPVETDDEGSFIIPMITGKPINDLSLKISLDNSILSVNNPSDNLNYPSNFWFKFIGGDPYSWKLPLNQGKYEYDFLMSDVNKAKKLYYYLLQLDSWTNQQTQNTLESKKLTVYYPINGQSLYEDYKIYFIVDDEINWNHEYGHFIQNRTNKKNLLNLAELLTSLTNPQGHQPQIHLTSNPGYSETYAEAYAFVEGWAEFISVGSLEPPIPILDYTPKLVQWDNKYISKYDFEKSMYDARTKENSNFYWYDFEKGGNVEGRNAAVLWDLFDNDIETITKWDWSWKPPFVIKKVSIVDNYDGNYQIKDMVDILKSNNFNTQKELQLLRDGYWFDWDKIPTDDNDDKSLKYYLIEDYHLDWAETAKLEKIDDGKTINVSNNKNYLLLKLNNEKTKVNLEIDDGRTDEFIVKTEDAKLNVYRKGLDPKDYRPLTMVEFFDAWVANNKPYPDRFANILANQGWDTGKLTAYSPVTIHLYDSSEKHTGINETNGETERNVLASYYSGHNVHPEELDWIGEDNYSLIIRGADYGTADLELNLTHKGITTSAFYEKVPITPVSKASIADNWGTSSFLLSVDNNGDGTIDEVLMPSSISVEGGELYNVTFIPPLNSTNVYAFSNGILPIRFSARNITNNEFVIDLSVNVSITNAKGDVIASFANDSGFPRVIWDSTEEQYSVELETQNYPLIYGQTYAVSVTFGNETDRKGYALAYFRLTDSTPPTTNLTLSGALGNNGWYTSDVQVNLAAIDNEGGSGLNTTDYSFDNTTWNTYTVPFNITSEGTTTLYYNSTDNAGNIESAKNQTIKIDKTPPQITINTPANGSSYILNQTVLANWSANDSLSGIASVTVTTPNGEAIDTATVGNKTFSVNATDNAGNKANKTVTYSVVYNYSDLLPPFKANGNNDFKLDRTIPIKFQLLDASGKYIATATACIYLAKVTDRVADEEVNGTSSGNANTGNLFRYDSTENQYIFNLATKPLSIGTWQIRINLDDGTSKYATIKLKS